MLCLGSFLSQNMSLNVGFQFEGRSLKYSLSTFQRKVDNWQPQAGGHVTGPCRRSISGMGRMTFCKVCPQAFSHFLWPHFSLFFGALFSVLRLTNWTPRRGYLVGIKGSFFSLTESLQLKVVPEAHLFPFDWRYILCTVLWVEYGCQLCSLLVWQSWVTQQLRHSHEWETESELRTVRLVESYVFRTLC